MIDALEISYDLRTLPTAQHRAGLAGLAIVTDAMRRRGIANVPEIHSHDDAGLRIILTAATLTSLIDYLYEADLAEVRSKTQRKDRTGELVEPLRVETETTLNERTGRETTKTFHIYNRVLPKAPFLEALNIPEPWLKLWRDAVWDTLRGIPKTRLPYDQRAAGMSTQEAVRLWADLVRWKKAGVRFTPYTAPVSSSMFIGAQEVNAERVPFVGSIDQNLLLHFWPVVTGFGEVRRIKQDKEGLKEEPAGYVLAVPDVADLESFTHDYRTRVAQLDPATAGYRPRAAILSIPQEGALQYLSSLVSLAAAHAQAGEIRFSVTGVEVYHLAKVGNTIPILGTGRVPAARELVDGYDKIRTHYWNLMFRAQLIRNLLSGVPWYAGFDGVFATRDAGMFIGPSTKWFTDDARRKFESEFLAGGIRNDHRNATPI